MKLHGKKKEVAFALMHLARHTGDRYRDVSDDTRTDIVTWLNEHGASGRLTTLVRSGGLLDAEEQDQAFGEALPPGLHLAG